MLLQKRLQVFELFVMQLVDVCIKIALSIAAAACLFSSSIFLGANFTAYVEGCVEWILKFVPRLVTCFVAYGLQRSVFRITSDDAN